MIWGVFSGQMTTRVKDKLKSLNIVLVPVPANMTHFFQPLDLTVNGSAKMFTRKQFTEYYSDAVRSQLDDGKEIEDIQVDFRLTSVKPLHAQWLISMYNHLTLCTHAALIITFAVRVAVFLYSILVWTITKKRVVPRRTSILEV